MREIIEKAIAEHEEHLNKMANIDNKWLVEVEQRNIEMKGKYIHFQNKILKFNKIFFSSEDNKWYLQHDGGYIENLMVDIESDVIDICKFPFAYTKIIENMPSEKQILKLRSYAKKY